MSWSGVKGLFRCGFGSSATGSAVALGWLETMVRLPSDGIAPKVVRGAAGGVEALAGLGALGVLGALAGLGVLETLAALDELEMLDELDVLGAGVR